MNLFLKYFFASLFIVVFLVLTVFGISFFQHELGRKDLSQEFLLKVPKEKILDYRDSQGKIIYHYISDKEVPAETYQGLKEDLTKRTNNSQTFLKSVTPISDKLQKEEYVAKFYTGQTFQKSGDKWYQVETATTTPAAFASQIKLTLLDKVKGFFVQEAFADTVYSGTGDGYVQNSGADWSTVRLDLAGDSSNHTGSYIQNSTILFGGTYYISRSFLPFDTSSISSDTVITEANLYIYPISRTISSIDPFFSGLLVSANSTQTNSDSLVVGDYSKYGTDNGSYYINYADFTLNTYNEIPLYPDGMMFTNAIKRNGEASTCGSVTGFTCLSLRDGFDEYDQTLLSSDNSILQFSSSNAAGTSQDPYLSVTYTIIAPVVIKIDGGTIKIDGGTIKINN